MVPLDDFKLSGNPVAPLALIATPGAEEFAKLIDERLKKLFKDTDFYPQNGKDTYIIDSIYPRFTSGDGKALLNETVRGKDLYIITDVGNRGVHFDFFGSKIPMTPDEHYANLKRIICACQNKPTRITVIMPMLYGGRQHRRNARESLDCAMMLQELQSLGIKDIITFDAHDPRVQNAVPYMGFDNYFPHYQVLKLLTKNFPEVKLEKNSLMCISPDEGAMGRNIYYASVLGVDLGMFYKRRDYTQVVNGRNPIVAHEYLGNPVLGMNVFVADDIIATGDSILKLAKEIKEKGAEKVFLTATFAIFSEGVEKFNKAYEEGIFDAVFSTNLTYTPPELEGCKWYYKADMSKYTSIIIAASNFNESVSNLIDPSAKINALLGRI